MDHGDEDSTGEQDGGPEIPAGVLRTQKRGWAGEDLELEHRRQQLQQPDKPAEDHAAVDLKQFRNTEVGKGYQARHVIRQRSGQGEQMQVHDMTHREEPPEKPRETSEQRKRSREKPVGERDSKERRLEKYLSCEGLRNFRLEIERILSSQKQA